MEIKIKYLPGTKLMKLSVYFSSFLITPGMFLIEFLLFISRNTLPDVMGRDETHAFAFLLPVLF